MKRFIRCICLILVAVTLMTTPAFAAESVSARSSSFFACSSVFLWKTSDTTFEVWFDVTCLHIMEKTGASVIKVQRSGDGTNWTTMKTYKMADYPELICENTATHVGCVSYTGTCGYFYRAIITLYAKNSSGIGEVTEYTDSLRL